MKNHNIWAPWRAEYLKSLDDVSDGSPGCFLCNYWAQPEQDKKNLVLWRTKQCIVLLNRFPYTGGHLLIAPAAHVANLCELEEDILLEIMILARDAQNVLEHVIKPHGFNIGMNINRCAGAGLPDHIHMHLVPRWDGDTNFMAVTGHIRVISQALDDLYKKLYESSKILNLPTVE